MVHRAIFGSIERFFGVLLESTAGDLPLWIAPVQMRLLPVTENAMAFCEVNCCELVCHSLSISSLFCCSFSFQTVAKKAKKMGLRVDIDKANDRLGKQIRNAEQSRIPIMAIVGEQEILDKTLAIRSRKG